jgi:hypothetical protein
MFHSASKSDVPHSPRRDVEARRASLRNALPLSPPTREEEIVSTGTWHQTVKKRHRQEDSYYPVHKERHLQRCVSCPSVVARPQSGVRSLFGHCRGDRPACLCREQGEGGRAACSETDLRTAHGRIGAIGGPSVVANPDALVIKRINTVGEGYRSISRAVSFDSSPPIRGDVIPRCVRPCSHSQEHPPVHGRRTFSRHKDGWIGSLRDWRCLQRLCCQGPWDHFGFAGVDRGIRRRTGVSFCSLRPRFTLNTLGAFRALEALLIPGQSDLGALAVPLLQQPHSACRLVGTGRNRGIARGRHITHRPDRGRGDDNTNTEGTQSAEPHPCLQFFLLLQPSCFEPFLDFDPIPDLTHLQFCHGLGEVGMTPTPGVHRVGESKSETASDLVRPYEVLRIN